MAALGNQYGIFINEKSLQLISKLEQVEGGAVESKPDSSRVLTGALGLCDATALVPRSGETAALLHWGGWQRSDFPLPGKDRRVPGYQLACPAALNSPTRLA